MKYYSLSFLALTLALQADQNGADPRLTDAPGDQTCVACHAGTKLNGGGGSVTVQLPGPANYTPGVKQQLVVKIVDAAATRYGFELTARLGSDLTNGQAGSFATVDANTSVKCDNGRRAPCSSASVVQFATHTLAGARSGSNTFTIEWTPPATDAGNVRLYVAGNAANGNGSNSGDHIYTSSVELSPAASSPKPTISSTGGVANGASFEAAISEGAWITIKGTNLATTTRTWTAAELASGKLPIALDGVSVSVNGKAAYVQYISPTQINAVSPADHAVGPVEVRVTANGQTSDAAMATIQSFAPALFTFDGKFLAATHASSALLGKAGLFPAAPTATTPAKPGEIFVMYGTGFGATSPVVAAGEVTGSVAPLANPIKVSIGGVSALVAFAGLVPPFARLYQFNVTVPDAAPDGDQPVVVEIGGVSSLKNESCCMITIQR